MAGVPRAGPLQRGDEVTGFGRFDGVAAADLVKFEQVKRTSG
jgi:hypothetical protein